ncbi:related to thermoresistant gluconokinase [Cephalotrichum gorgonifer]|uniref:Gluconokinase n=1 Tax=Cephalotrichum gorgonifer TaxID=2041049 RepID=A0AAE8MPP5_9PEZI|nr:related to thermoresistant gluconokinase [Cephalotrichum gorgonifer]
MLSYDTPVPIAGNSAPTSINIQPNMTNGNAQTTTSAAAAAAMAGRTADTEKVHHIWLVTGPAGVGKSSVAAFLAKSIGMPYIEGDDFHSAANVEKMANGTPLTDADRWDWLTALREESLRQIRGGSSGVVLTCSALKQKYRDVIRVAGYFDRSLLIHFIYLSAPESLLLARVEARQDHYMGANMVHSQLEALEPPGPEESDVVSIDVSGTLEEVQREALSRVLSIMTDEPNGRL